MSNSSLNHAVWQAITAILDPEFGINIVELGLIYDVNCIEGHATVVMTLTTPTCPSGAWIHQGVKAAIEQVPGVKTARVDLVFAPPWTPEMLSLEARRQLGWNPVSDR